ncbi:winged helix-turn-helix transcriptional regulator [Candidatus Woesearchaeota archaeon]|nr:winged helix-turn-helix transcriptional regulator [Candidatus Woesearchaeota archaeon]
MIKKAYKTFFGTLDNERRLEIINTLRKAPKCVSEICKLLDFNQTTVSHNLERLEKCGFVFMAKKGKHRIYALNKKTIKPLMNLIDKHMHEFCEKIVAGER